MPDMTPSQVAAALKRLGRYRVGRAHEVAALRHDGIGGHHYLALGMREVGPFQHWNIEGGARLVNGRWVKEDDPDMMDVGPFQISRKWHKAALARMKAVAVATWKPLIAGKTAADGGYAPRWSDSLTYVDRSFEANLDFGQTHGVRREDLVRFAIAAHNAGQGGALRGYREGDVDRYTTGGDYSAQVLRYAKVIKEWIADHPAWRRSR